MNSTLEHMRKLGDLLLTDLYYPYFKQLLKENRNG